MKVREIDNQINNKLFNKQKVFIPYNLFAFSSLNFYKNNNTNNPYYINGKNLLPINKVMKCCEKYSKVLFNQSAFEHLYNSQNGYISKKMPKISDVINFSDSEENVVDLDKGLRFFQNDMVEISQNLNEVSSNSFNTLIQLANECFNVGENLQKINLNLYKEIPTIIPVINEIEPIDYDDLDDSNVIGTIINDGRFLNENETIPVAKFKIKETFNLEQNTNLPTSISMFPEISTLKGFIYANSIEKIAQKGFKEIVSSKEANKSEQIFNEIYNEIIKDLKLKQEEILIVKEKLNSLKNQVMECEDKIQFNEHKISKLEENNKSTDKFRISRQSLIEEKNRLVTETQGVDNQLAMLISKIKYEAKKLNVNESQISNIAYQKFLSIYSDEIEKTKKDFNKKYNVSLDGLGERVVYYSDAEKKTYILPEVIKNVPDGKIDINLSMCPTLEDDTDLGVWQLNAFKIDKSNKGEIELQNKIFENFFSTCENLNFVELTKKQRNIKDNEYYSALNNKVFVQKVITENGKQREIFGYEKIIRSMYAIIGTQTPKKLINKNNDKLLEITKLRVLEFMCRGIPGLGKEKAQEICSEIQNKIIKKSVLVNSVDVPLTDVVEQSNEIAIQILKKVYANIAISIQDLPEVHKQNGFTYSPIKVGKHSLQDWFNCPIENNDDNLFMIELKKNENIKILSLNKFLKFSNFNTYQEKYAKKFKQTQIDNCFNNDGCVKLCDAMNKQLNYLYEFTKRKHFTNSLKKQLCECSAQILSLLSKDKSGKILELISLETRNLDGAINPNSLIKNLETINNSLENANNEIKTQEFFKSKNIDESLETLKNMSFNLNVQAKQESSKRDFDEYSEVLASKLDFYLNKSNINFEYVNYGLEGCKFLLEDVVKPTSEFKKLLKLVLTEESDFDNLETAIMGIIKINPNNSVNSNLNAKDVVRKIVNSVCETGYDIINNQVNNDKLNKNLIEKMASKSKKKTEQVEMLIDYRFNKDEMAKSLMIIENSPILAEFINQRIEALEEFKSLTSFEKIPKDERVEIENNLLKVWNIKLKDVKKNLFSNNQGQKKNDF